MLTPSSKLRSTVQELTWEQKVIFKYSFFYPCSGWGFPAFPFMLRYRCSTWCRSCSQERETPGSHANQSSGMLSFILNHQRLKNELMFWGRCFGIQSHRRTVPSTSSVFANLETFISEKKKTICSHGHDLEPAV